MRNVYLKIKYSILTLKNLFLEHHGEDHDLIQENNISNFFFILGSTLLVFLFSLFAVPSFLFLIGVSINPYIPLISIALSFVFLSASSYLLFPKNWLIISVGAFLILGLIIYISTDQARRFYDLSWDGQGYHQDTIILLKDGWNPIYRRLQQEDTPGLPRWKWLTYYPKAAEISQASIYSLTNKIELSKAINLLSSFSALFFAIAFFRRIHRVNLLTALFIGLLLVINPVSIIQSQSFYVDILLYNFFLILIFSSLLTFSSKRIIFLVPMSFSLIYLINIKTTGILYGGMLIAALSVFVWYHEKIKLSLKVFYTALISGLLAVVVFGFNPYVTNTFYYKNPIYPVGSIDAEYASANAPGNLKDKSSFYSMIVSVFSRTDNLRNAQGSSQLKIPFTTTKEEIAEFASEDPTTGGFGPYFSGILLVSLLLVLILYFAIKTKTFTYYLIGSLVLIFVSVLFNPSANYSRQVPQLWVIPVVVVTFCLLQKNAIIKILGLLTSFLIIFNGYLIAKEYYLYNIQKSNEMRSELSDLSRQSQVEPLIVYFDAFRSNRVRFREANINYKESIETLNCNKKKILRTTETDIRTEMCIE